MRLRSQYIMRCEKGRKIRNIDEKIWSVIKSYRRMQSTKRKNMSYIFINTSGQK